MIIEHHLQLRKVYDRQFFFIQPYDGNTCAAPKSAVPRPLTVLKQYTERQKEDASVI